MGRNSGIQVGLIGFSKKTSQALFFLALLSSTEVSFSRRLSVRRVEKRPPAALPHNSDLLLQSSSKVPGPTLIGWDWVMCSSQNQSLWPRIGSILIGGAWLSTHLSPGASAGERACDQRSWVREGTAKESLGLGWGIMKGAKGEGREERARPLAQTSQR